MTLRLADRGIRLVLLDIEGTTTPIAFVHDVLFPFARLHLTDWCESAAGSAEYTEVLRQLSAEHAEDLGRGEPVPAWTSDRESVINYARWLMDRDRKSPGLKLMQGLIWERGYQAGALHGQVFPDVPDAIRRWRAAGVDVAIYSSGSELAQRRLFASTPYGDLTPYICGFFDTSVGAKLARESYDRILAIVERSPSEVLFISDSPGELHAARAAGLAVLLSVRPGNPPTPDAAFSTVTDFSVLD